MSTNVQVNLRMNRAELDRLDALNPGTSRTAFIRTLIGEADGAELLKARANARQDTLVELAPVLKGAKDAVEAAVAQLAGRETGAER
jgi:hypothetical protein